jgi:hypothetical protein
MAIPRDGPSRTGAKKPAKGTKERKRAAKEAADAAQIASDEAAKTRVSPNATPSHSLADESPAASGDNAPSYSDRVRGAGLGSPSRSDPEGTPGGGATSDDEATTRSATAAARAAERKGGDMMVLVMCCNFCEKKQGGSQRSKDAGIAASTITAQAKALVGNFEKALLKQAADALPTVFPDTQCWPENVKRVKSGLGYATAIAQGWYHGYVVTSSPPPADRDSDPPPSGKRQRSSSPSGSDVPPPQRKGPKKAATKRASPSPVRGGAAGDRGVGHLPSVEGEADSSASEEEASGDAATRKPSGDKRKTNVRSHSPTLSLSACRHPHANEF